MNSKENLTENDYMNEILRVLYDEKGSLSPHKIYKGMNNDLAIKGKELDFYLRLLIDKGYVNINKTYIKKQVVKSSGNQKFTTGGFHDEQYSISLKGIDYAKNDYTELNKKDILNDIASGILSIDKNTAETNEILLAQGRTLEIILNSMGEQHQKTMRELISIEGYLKEFINLMDNSFPDKENKISEFFKKLSGDLTIELIKEYIKYKVGYK